MKKGIIKCVRSLKESCLQLISASYTARPVSQSHVGAKKAVNPAKLSWQHPFLERWFFNI
jgi:hypothetical protein